MLSLATPLRTTRAPRVLRAPRAPRTAGQRGVILVLALIMLVVLTLGGIALLRSVSTTNVVAGNLAFQQAATNSADVGAETAITWLQDNNIGTTLQASVAASGYFATRQDPSTGQSWDDFWQAGLKANAITVGTDAAGNTVMYVIHRMCNATGPQSGADCSVPPMDVSAQDGSMDSGSELPAPDPQIYYRITTRVTGPRNTVSYVQTMIAL